MGSPTRWSGQDVVQADPVVAQAFSHPPQPAQLAEAVAGVVDTYAKPGHTSDAIMRAARRGLTVRQGHKMQQQ